MWTWLINLIRRFAGIGTRRRRIFTYWDGRNVRSIDPILALIALQSHPEYDYRTHPDLVDAGDEEAVRITCDAVRRAFGVTAYDAVCKRGLTIDETLELLATFCVYLEALKKSIGKPVTSPSPTAPTSTGSPATTTSNTSASGSIGTGPSSGTPTGSAAR